MAKTLLATVEVYLDKDAPESSAIEIHDAHAPGPKKVTIVLRPKGDMPVMKDVKPTMADVLAHEFGHLVGFIMKDPLACDSGYASTTANEQYKGEKRAWHYAEEMVPGLKDSKLEKGVEAHYKEIADHAGNMPMGLLEDLGLVGHIPEDDD